MKKHYPKISWESAPQLCIPLLYSVKNSSSVVENLNSIYVVNVLKYEIKWTSYEMISIALFHFQTEANLYPQTIDASHFWSSDTDFGYTNLGIPELNHNQSRNLQQVKCFVVTLSWRRSLSHRNKWIDFFCESLDWFLYHRDPPHKRVK